MFQSGFALNLGPITIPITFLGVGLSFFIWYLLVRSQDKGIQSAVDDKWRLSDSLASLAVTGLLLYKLWPVITNPAFIWTRGLSVIYYSGGSYYQVGLFLLLLAWFGRTVKKHCISWHKSGQIIVRGLIPALASWYLLVREYGVMTTMSFGFNYQGQLYQPINFYFAIILFLLFACLLLLQNSNYPVEPWVMLILSCFYIILAPIRMSQEVFIIFDGVVWAWIIAFSSLLWIIFYQSRRFSFES